MADQDEQQAHAWANETFGHAVLGDARRVARLVTMAAAVASRPAGTVTQVFTRSADREGAFRWLQSSQVDAAAVAHAAHRATARKSAGQAWVYVALDGSSLTLTDRTGHRELGRVGKPLPVRGLQVMNALAVDPHGVPLGLVDQRWWAREQPPKEKKIKSWKGDLQDKETRYWVDSLLAVEAQMAQHAAGTKPWFQLDRGGDCWAVLQTAIERSLLLTVRATHNRRLVLPQGRTGYLRDHLRRQRPVGTYDLSVPAHPGRTARVARMSVRIAPVTLDLRVSRKQHVHVQLQACLAREQGGPKGDRLEWLLLTTHPLRSFDEACAVLHGYTQRWRVEELHRAWKGGVCHVEQTQLHSRQAIVKWATLLAAVAARAVRLAYLARTTPEVEASTEFSPYEIEAAFLLAKRKRDRRRKVLLGEMIALVAQEGGFAGEYSGRPPGAQVLARGLERIATLAKGLRNLEEM